MLAHPARRRSCPTRVGSHSRWRLLSSDVRQNRLSQYCLAVVLKRGIWAVGRSRAVIVPGLQNRRWQRLSSVAPVFIGRRARSVCPELRHCGSTSDCNTILETCCSNRSCLRFYEQNGYWTDALPNKSLQPTATALSATDERWQLSLRHAGCLGIRRAVAFIQLVSGVILGGGC